MRFQRLWFLCITFVFAVVAEQSKAEIVFTNLLSFTESTGNRPKGSLLLHDGSFYGMTMWGAGPNNHNGVVFKLNTNGTDYTILHQFTGYPSDGLYPLGGLVASGSILFGVTFSGGSNDVGTVFRLRTSGEDYAVIHHFSSSSGNGGYGPVGDLLISGNTLYGTTQIGGTYYDGGVFSICTDGTGYTVLHQFGSPGDLGYNPSGKLLVSGSTLYGMTRNGSSGTSTIGPRGTVFALETNGSDYRTIHAFQGGLEDGALSSGSHNGGLIVIDGNLYGMTTNGGKNDKGVLFRVSSDGMMYTNLVHFADLNSSGAYGSLTLSGGTLYGMTASGQIFQTNPDASNFKKIYFLGTGAAPTGDITPVGEKLYGLTFTGGSSSLGSVFAVSVKLPDLVVTSITAPQYGFTNQSVSIRFEIVNEGVGAVSDPVRAPLWNDHVYLCDNATLGSSAIQLASVPRTGLLSPGATYMTNVIVRLPAVPYGDYYINVVADATNALWELNELNNASVSTIHIVDRVLNMPVAKAGLDQVGFVGQTVSLDGSGCSNAQHYTWSILSKPAGSTVQLIGADMVTPNLCPDLPGQYIAQVIVDFYGLTSTPSTVTITASWINWTISSRFGQPTPGTGTHQYAYGTVLTNIVEASVQIGETQYACAGWSLAGQEPATGANNQFANVVTNNAAVTWSWATNYWLQTQINGGGTLSQTSGWYAAGSTQSVTSMPSYGWLLTGWSGDVSAGHMVSNMNLLMYRPWHLTVSYSDDPDGDGLKNVDEWNVGSDPWNPDTDSDKFDDGWESIYGWDPVVPNTEVLSYILSNKAKFDVYTRNEIGSLAPGSLLIGVVSNTVNLSVQLEQSPDLQPNTWTNAGEAVKWSIPVITNKAFYRVGIKE